MERPQLLLALVLTLQQVAHNLLQLHYGGHVRFSAATRSKSYVFLANGKSDLRPLSQLRVGVAAKIVVDRPCSVATESGASPTHSQDHRRRGPHGSEEIERLGYHARTLPIAPSPWRLNPTWLHMLTWSHESRQVCEKRCAHKPSPASQNSAGARMSSGDLPTVRSQPMTSRPRDAPAARRRSSPRRWNL